MKKVQYLSPTSIATWEKDQEEFYLQYLSDNRPPKIPQTAPMSIGSAFDAYTKSYLHERLYGAGNNPKYAFEALFEAQVEPANRDWARDHGKYVFEEYKSSGALADLFTELRSAQGDVRMEFEIRGAVSGYREGSSRTIGSVMLLGKPDVAFVNKAGAYVVLDWKVNGYLSKNPPSPLQGYLRLRSGGRTSHGMHKKCQPMTIDGMMVNCGGTLEEYSRDWARQLAIYSWLLGQPVPSDFIVAIDQLVCDARTGDRPSIRVAEHRCRIGKEFQSRTFHQAVEIWEIIHSDHIFRDMTLEESADRCKVLDGVSDALKGESSEDKWFAEVCRIGSKW